MPPSDESTPLSDKASELLLQLWYQVQSNDRRLTRVQLRKLAQQLSSDALEAGLRSEELIIAIKESWKSREVVTRARNPERMQGVIDEFISLCITEYYPKGDDPDESRGGWDRHRTSPIKP
jgi:hypothetical protein